MKYNVLSVFIALVGHIATAQDKGCFSIGSSIGGEYATSIISGNATDILIIGRTQELGFSGWDMYLVAFPAIPYVNVDTLWTKTIGGASATKDNFAEDITLSMPDSFYIVTGYSNSFGTSLDIFLTALKWNGTVLWSKTYGGTGIETARGITTTTDYGYAITGRTSSYGVGSSDMFVLKTDGLGGVQWATTIGGTRTEFSWDIIQDTVDGGIIAVGSSFSFSSNGESAYIVKLLNSGAVSWTAVFDTTNVTVFRAVAMFPNGQYVACGYLTDTTGDRDILVAVFDRQDGFYAWSMRAGGSADDVAYDIVIAPDGDAILVGYTESYSQDNSDIFIMKFDSMGTVKWMKTIDAGGEESGMAITPSIAGYHIGGNIRKNGSFPKLLVTSINSEGKISCSQCVSTPVNMTIKNYSPNVVMNVGDTTFFSPVATTVSPMFSSGGSLSAFSSNFITSISYDSLSASLTANISGGIPPYSFFWSTGDTTQTIFINKPDTYSVIVQDITGCLAVDTIIITDSIVLNNVALSTRKQCLIKKNGQNILVHCTEKIENIMIYSLLGSTVFTSTNIGKNQEFLIGFEYFPVQPTIILINLTDGQTIKQMIH